MEIAKLRYYDELAIELPTMSPDVNLIENVWSYKMKLKGKSMYTLKQLLFSKLKKYSAFY